MNRPKKAEFSSPIHWGAFLISSLRTHLNNNSSMMLDVIYDGQCSLCSRIVRIMKFFDVFRQLRFYNLHDHKAIRVKFSMIDYADLPNFMYAIDEKRKFFRGFYAFRRILPVSPFFWLLIPLFYFPGASLIGTAVYRWVAKNRKRFGCGSSSCPI